MSGLKQKRLALDLESEEVAKRIGVSPQTYSCWETGTRVPRAGIYAKLAKVLRISTTELVQTIAQQQREREQEARAEAAASK